MNKHKISKYKAFNNLKDFKNICEKNNISFFLDGGTLLGAYRDGDFCEDDHNDIDLTTLHDNWNLKDVIMIDSTRLNFKTYKKLDHETYLQKNILSSSQLSLKRDNGKIDIMFKKIKNNFLWWTVFSKKQKVVYKKVPYEYVKKLKTIKFYGEDFFIPEKTEEYLSYRYGNWKVKVHRKNYSCYHSDLSIVNNYEEI